MRRSFMAVLAVIFLLTGTWSALQAAPERKQAKPERMIEEKTAASGEKTVSTSHILAKKITSRLENNLNSKAAYSGIVLIFAMLVAGVLGMVLRRRRSPQADGIGVVFRERAASPLTAAILVIGVYIAILPYLADFGDNAFAMADKALKAVLAAMFAWFLYRFSDLLDFALKMHLGDSHGGLIDALMLSVIRKIVKVVVIVIAVLFIGQNVFEMNITTLLAGAGVAGLAVAFAAQDTIANFFGSIMLIIDKPFAVGEFIKVDTFSGTVERVGLRSTRLRTLEGHLITLPNKNVAGNPVENISQRPSIRKVFALGLTYDTPPEKMRRAIEILHELFDGDEHMKPEFPPVVNFTEFKDFSLNIVVTVWFFPNDFKMCTAWMSQKNLEILERFNAESLDFAFPTNTAYLAADPKHPFPVKGA